MTSIVLTHPHTHAGKAYAAGDRIDVDRGSAEWLMTNGVARHAPTTRPTPAEPVSPPISHKEPQP